MTTDREIRRFVANMNTDDIQSAFVLFDALCDHYEFQGAFFGKLDVCQAFNEVWGRPITETELESIHEQIDLWGLLSEVGYEHLKRVSYDYLTNQQEETQ